MTNKKIAKIFFVLVALIFFSSFLSVQVSAYKIINISREHSTGDIAITWDAVIGEKYKVLYQDTFGGKWTKAEEITVLENPEIWVDDGTSTGTHPDSIVERYYMIEKKVGKIPSANTVGKYRVDLDPYDVRLASFPLFPFDEHIQYQVGPQMTGAPDEGYADRIWTWNLTEHKYDYSWYVEGVGPPYDGKWYQTQPLRPSEMMLNGKQGMMMQSRQAFPESVHFTGEVSETDQVFNMVGYSGLGTGITGFGMPFPVVIDLDTCGLENHAIGAAEPQNADQIWVAFNNLYIRAFFCDDGTGNPPCNGVWLNVTDRQPFPYDLEPGMSYEYHRMGATGFQWTLVKPYQNPPN